MTDQSVIVAEAREALQLVKAHSKQLFENWLKIGDGLNVGRSECLKLTGSNSLQTPAYRKHWRRWLNDNGFGEMDGHERLNAMWVAENKAEVIRWRDGLGEAARRHANHPNVIIKHMGAGTRPAVRGPKPRQTSNHVVEQDVRRRGADFYGPRPARPAQDLIRRVANAMRSSGKQDWLQLATIAIEALTAADLCDLMPAKAARAAMVPALELHA